jgi:hypothetical protein
MSDLKYGQTMTAARRFVSGGVAYTLDLPFQADKVVFNNLTDWTNTAGNIPVSVWFRDETDAAEAYQQQVIDSAAAQSFNFLNPTTNGFTTADTSGGVTAYRSLISAVSLADPCVITTTAAHGLQTDQIVRITDLGSGMPTARGGDELNNNRYQIVVIDTTNFSLKDPVTGEPIDSTNFTAWVAGGRVTLESRTLTLNNPQVDPYATTPYSPTDFSYDPVEYKLTAGTSVIGSDGDRFYVEIYRFGDVINLGDIG